MFEEGFSESEEAALYNRVSNRQFTDACLLIDELLKPQTGESILDLGCGTGRAAMVLASRVGPSGRIFGVDPNKSRIEIAQQILTKSEIKQASFMAGTCVDAISRGPFDAIFSTHVLHWITDHGSALRDANKCLRPGGRFVFITAADAPPILKTICRGLYGSVEVSALLGHKYGNVEYWSKTCTEAGFKVESMEEKTVSHSFPDAISAMNFVKASSLVSDVVTLPSVKKEDVVEWLKPYTDDNTGQIISASPIVKALVRKTVQIVAD
jgi:ubiquinone/menaquinone biosynthesis C-methylase UbiE